MNCKQGDLAVIVRSANGNEGRFVQCLRLATSAEVRDELFSWDGPVWVIDTSLPSTIGEPTNLYPDIRMRPLRDTDGQDEMLRLVGLPAGTPQAA